jgi:hypothetical protein
LGSAFFRSASPRHSPWYGRGPGPGGW